MMKYLVALGLLVALSGRASAQFGSLLDKAKQKANDAVDNATDKAVNNATQPKPQATPAPAQAQGQNSAGQSGGSSAAPASSAQAQGAAGASGAPPPGQVYGNRFDFVPGDHVIVYDDFSDTDVGDFPARWTLKNGGGGNAVEVVQLGGRRFLKSRYQAKDQDEGRVYLRYDPKGDMPKNFTIEFDADVKGSYSVLFNANAHAGGPEGTSGAEVSFRSGWHGEVKAMNASGRLPNVSGIQHVAISVSGTALKLYIGGERVLIDSDGVNRPLVRIGIRFLSPIEDEGDHQAITAFRLAEGGKDMKTMLVSGRIVTHGILFDTGSEVLKPESGPALRGILALLQQDGSLRFSIEGHTDNQGGPKLNGPLSERRAAAVKTWLVAQGIDQGRLSSKGFGDTKPIDSNDTSEGRANNRRVEFVKVGASS
ncbi:MAG TPA: OmpA family protein [Anaeromyxobacteraceae bacterium]|nr:OmpA family protein [Anaeromyxobacteraceae bacterium]